MNPVSATNSTPATISGHSSPASGVPAINPCNKIPTGISSSTTSAPIQANDRSCSVRSSASPARRRACAAKAETTPPATGRASRTKVHSALTASAAANTKRTLCRHRSIARSTAGTCASGCHMVISGTATPQASTSPVSIAIPAARPIRCPAPNSASCMLIVMPVAAAPNRA